MDVRLIWFCDVCHPTGLLGLILLIWLTSRVPPFSLSAPNDSLLKRVNFSKEDPTYVTYVGVAALLFENLLITSQELVC